MALISSSIPNLVNGVSQQPAPHRLPTQGELQVNLMSSVVEGLRTRPSLEHIKQIYPINGTPLEQSSVHFIQRDTQESYCLLIPPNANTFNLPQIIDLEGNQKSLGYQGGSLAYISSPSPREDLRCLTIADHTFILNTTKIPLMGTSRSPVQTGEALVHVKQGNYSQDYKIFVDGVLQASKTTSSTDKEDIRTNTIAESLRSQLATNIGASYWVYRENFCLWIKKKDGTAFTVKVEDSFGGNALKVVKETVQRFSDLPTVAPRDYVVKISGDTGSDADDYYCKFVPDNTTSAFDAGVWVETVGPNVVLDIDPNTMPQVLVREADGTFSLKAFVWGQRDAGDVETAPDPSFIGVPISDMFLFKNRLGFLSDQNVSLSRASRFGDFCPETVTTIKDSDPIDVACGHSKVAMLRTATPFDEKLLLLSDQVQFTMAGGDLLTPTTAEIDVASEFEVSTNTRPVGIGPRLYIPTANGVHAGLLEYTKSDVNKYEAPAISSHVPSFLPKDIHILVASPSENMLASLSDDAPNTLWVNKQYWAGAEKLQNSWSEWRFPSIHRIVGMDFQGSKLYLIYQEQMGGVVSLGVLDCADGVVGVGSLCLDKRCRVNHQDNPTVDGDEIRVVDYSATTGETRLQEFRASGESPPSDLLFFSGEANGFGSAITHRRVNYPGTIKQVYLKGDWTARTFYRGVPFQPHYQFSPPHLREESKGGGKSVIDNGRLQVLRWRIRYENSGPFRVVVNTKGRPSQEHKYLGRKVGDYLLGTITLSDGVFSFPVLSRNDRMTIDLYSDGILPVAFLSAEWEARYDSRSQRL